MRSSIMSASALLIVGTFFSKILGFYREILFAHKFGANVISDAFLLTNNIPNVLFSAFAVAINMNFIPLFIGIEGREGKNRFTSNLFNICLVFTLVGCLLVNLFPRQLLGLFVSSLSEETLRYAVVMLRIVSVSIVPVILQRLFQAYSQASGYFFSTAALGCVTNAALIATYLVATEETFYFLSLGVVLSQAAAMMLLFCNARKAGFRYSFVLDFKDSWARKLLLLTIPLMLGKFAEDASLLVDQNLAAGIGTGVISGLSYASLLAKAIGSIVIGSVTTAAFPTFSQLATEGQKEKFVTVFQKYFGALCYTLCPISVFMVLFADDIVVAVLQHGALKASATQMIWEATACYAVGLLPLGVQNYMVRGFYSFRDTKTPTYIVVFSLLINIFLSVWSAPYWGHIGITCATSVSYFIAGILLMYVFSRKYGMPIFTSLHKDILSYLLMAAMPAVTVYWLFRVFCFTDSVVVRAILESSLFFLSYSVLFFATHQEMRQHMISWIGKHL